jgi:hypothetical protein
MLMEEKMTVNTQNPMKNSMIAAKTYKLTLYQLESIKLPILRNSIKDCNINQILLKVDLGATQTDLADGVGKVAIMFRAPPKNGNLCR